MEINNFTFQSRNKEIRIADKIMRNMIQQYPASSITRIAEKFPIKKYPRIYFTHILKLNSKMEDIRYIYSSKKGIEQDEMILNIVKKHKRANCGEYARMAKLAFLANGYKDLCLGRLQLLHVNKDTKKQVLIKDLDHIVLMLNKDSKNKSIIVDSLNGFADYSVNAIQNLKTIFAKTLKSYENTSYILKITPNKGEVYSEEIGKSFRDKYKELCI